MARPTKYKKEFDEQVVKLCILGATDVKISDFFEVDEATINRWKLKYTSFCESIKKGKIEADANVATSLYKRAIGYKHNEDKIFLHNGKPVVVATIKQYPPDTVAAIFFLKNRQPKQWRDKTEVENRIIIEQPLFPDDISTNESD